MATKKPTTKKAAAKKATTKKATTKKATTKKATTKKATKATAEKIGVSSCLDEPGLILSQKMCLNAVSKNFRGGLTQTVRQLQACAQPPCRTLKTVHAVKVEVQSNPPCDSPLGRRLDGVLRVDRLVTAYNTDGDHRGFHAGDFIWLGTAGTQAVGRMSGMTNVGTHRAPVFQPACQRCDTTGVMEGRICGEITQTQIPELRGCQIVGTYRIKFDSSAGGGANQTITGVIEAVVICSCQ
jgi:hypothetical protein